MNWFDIVLLAFGAAIILVVYKTRRHPSIDGYQPQGAETVMDPTLIRFYCVHDKRHFCTNLVEGVHRIGQVDWVVARHLGDDGCQFTAYRSVRQVRVETVRSGDIVEDKVGNYHVLVGRIPFKGLGFEAYETSRGDLIKFSDIRSAFRLDNSAA